MPRFPFGRYLIKKKWRGSLYCHSSCISRSYIPPLSELEKKKPLNRQAQSANKRLFFNKMSIPWLRQTAIPKECNKITNFTETNQIKSPKNGTSI